MTCACCGAYVPRFIQWPNQDTGYTLCGKCATWIAGRGGPNGTPKHPSPTIEADMVRCYGVAGVNRPLPLAPECAA